MADKQTDVLQKSHYQLKPKSSVTIRVKKYFRGLIITSGKTNAVQSMYLVYTTGNPNFTNSSGAIIKQIAHGDKIKVIENHIQTGFGGTGIIKILNTSALNVVVDVISFNHPVDFS